MSIPKEEIQDEIKDGNILITPRLNPDKEFETVKSDLRLDNKFYRMEAEKETHHDSVDSYEQLFDEIYIPYKGSDAEFVLHPGEFALARTYETIKISEDYVAHLGGRSSLARQGIVVHATASVIDPGFVGYITLEMTNFGDVPIKVHPLQRVASIIFEEINGESETYSGRFRGVGLPHTGGGDKSPVLEYILTDAQHSHES